MTPSPHAVIRALLTADVAALQALPSAPSWEARTYADEGVAKQLLQAGWVRNLRQVPVQGIDPIVLAVVQWVDALENRDKIEKGYGLDEFKDEVEARVSDCEQTARWVLEQAAPIGMRWVIPPTSPTGSPLSVWEDLVRRTPASGFPVAQAMWAAGAPRLDAPPSPQDTFYANPFCMLFQQYAQARHPASGALGFWVDHLIQYGADPREPTPTLNAPARRGNAPVTNALRTPLGHLLETWVKTSMGGDADTGISAVKALLDAGVRMEDSPAPGVAGAMSWLMSLRSVNAEGGHAQKRWHQLYEHLQAFAKAYDLRKNLETVAPTTETASTALNRPRL